jgi:hypothetical protein
MGSFLNFCRLSPILVSNVRLAHADQAEFPFEQASHSHLWSASSGPALLPAH